jgi:hypothetical protein
VDAVLIEIPDDSTADRHRLIVRNSDSETRELVLDLQTDQRRFCFQMDTLQAGRLYMARLLFLQEDDWPPLTSYWVFKGGDDIRYVSSDQAAANLLAVLADRDTPTPPDDILRFTVSFDSDPAHLRYLTRFVLRGWDRLCRDPRQVNAVALRTLARRSTSAKNVSLHVRTALDYLSLWTEVSHYFRQAQLNAVSYNKIFSNDEHITAIGAIVEHGSAELGTEYGVLMFRAMLASVRDRTTAAKAFQDARAENPEFAADQYLDYFASTYFTSTMIRANAGQIDERRAAVMNGFERYSDPENRDSSDTVLLFSCDPSFFAIYFPYWASIAEYLRHASAQMHFVLVGEDEKTTAAIEHGVTLSAAVSRLRGVDQAMRSSGISFSKVKVPDFVKDSTTFYACARYLVAQKLAKSVDSRVLILDIDMVLRADASAFFRDLADRSHELLPVVEGGGMPSLIPARRYMAGTFPLPESELGAQVMQHVERYVLAGLSCPTSWTLDQNALAYAMENVIEAHGPDILLNINSLKRPFVQVSVNQFYEVHHRRQENR